LTVTKNICLQDNRCTRAWAPTDILGEEARVEIIPDSQALNSQTEIIGKAESHREQGGGGGIQDTREA
jgi:hypothetical protein